MNREYDRVDPIETYDLYVSYKPRTAGHQQAMVLLGPPPRAHTLTGCTRGRTHRRRTRLAGSSLPGGFAPCLFELGRTDLEGHELVLDRYPLFPPVGLTHTSERAEMFTDQTAPAGSGSAPLRTTLTIANEGSKQSRSYPVSDTSSIFTAAAPHVSARSRMSRIIRTSGNIPYWS